MAFVRNLIARQVAAAQERLLMRFLHDPEYAEGMARHPAHARLGDWLPRGRGARVLELGCGPGKYVALLHTLGFRVMGVDPVRFPSWEVLRRETSALLLDRVRAEALPFPDGTFDHVVCLGALLYFDDLKKAMGEIRRVVKPGGRVIIRTVNSGNLYSSRTGKRLDPASRQLLSMQEIMQLAVENQLSVEEAYSYGFWPPLWPQLWWYLVCVWLPQGIQDFLSDRLDPSRRVNHVVLACSPT